MTEKSLNIKYSELESFNELDEDRKNLVLKAQQACVMAYAPYSGFSVGAAVKCNDGRVVTGNNQENAAYPSGLCAERVAIFSAVSQNPETHIKQLAIAVSTRDKNVVDPVAPCGACRQVIAEYEHRQGSKIEIIFTAETGKTIIVNGVSTLLPFTFNSDYLPVK
ncbi:MAG TPA: cytidine deaminase [Lentimicrobium sp.]|jgi:cytidine deaminase|nr:cytidine deaminase [Lentimicrobium sp.]